MNSTNNGALWPLDILGGGLCDYCYGLTMECPSCSGTTAQLSMDQCHTSQDSYAADPQPRWSGGCKELSSVGACVEQSEVTQCSLEPSNTRRQQPSSNAEFVITTSGRLKAAGESKNDQGLEQTDQIPPYRRHTKSKSQVKLLRDWFAINPNPSGAQLSKYAKLSGLEKDQVRNWFVNQRRPSRRPKPRLISNGEDKRDFSPHPQNDLPKEPTLSSMATTKAIPIPGRSPRSSMTNSLRSIPDAPESMLERWRNSPPDEEPANLSAIKNALASSPNLDTRIPFARHYRRPVPAEGHFMVVIENIPRDMQRAQFVQIMLLKDIKRPDRFYYQFRHGEFSGLALAEFASIEDATFAISRLDHILLEGFTLIATLESDYERILKLPDTLVDHTTAHQLKPTGPFLAPTFFDENALANYFQDRSLHRTERTNSWRSAPSTDGSAVSSAARSAASSVSMARRRYKRAFRRSDYAQQNSISSYDGDNRSPKLLPIGQGSEAFFPDSLFHRPPTPRPPFAQSFESQPLNSPYAEALGTGNFEIFDEPEMIQGTDSQETDLRGVLATNDQPVSSHLGQPFRQTYHSCLRYRCEFCTKKFNIEEEWREHETLIHRPREEWVCSLVPCMKPTMKDWQCAFCQSTFTDWEIFINHSCQVCGLLPGSSTTRPTFHNRTDLADHVKHHHGRAALTPFMVAKWSRAPTEDGDIWPCITCGASLQGWENRLDHLAGHFSVDGSKRMCSCLRMIEDATIPDEDLEMLSNLSISTKSSKSRVYNEPDEDPEIIERFETSRSSTRIDVDPEVYTEFAQTEFQWPPFQLSGACSVTHKDQVNIPQNNSQGFMARARAWITKRVKRL